MVTQAPLSRVEALSSSLEVIVFPSVPPGWRRVGVACFQSGSIRRIDKTKNIPLAWALAFEWEASRSAWQALLEAQDSLQPQGFSLAPDLILPALFLGHLGMAPLDTHLGNWAERWALLLAGVQYDLAVLLNAWYLEWIRGPSEAAHRCRQAHNIAPSPHPRADEVVTAFEMLFGKQLTQSIRTAERLEPILLRGLAETSTRLFHKPMLSTGTDGSFGFSQYPQWIPPPRKRRRGWSVSLPEQLLRGFLSLGSWQTTELPDEIECLHLQKPEELLQAWIRWRAGYSDEIPAWIVDYLVKHLVINKDKQSSLD